MNTVPSRPLRTLHWRSRAWIVVQRFWQPTSACLACMPGGLEKVVSAVHLTTALSTGLVTGGIALALSFTPIARLYGHCYGNAFVVGCITAIGDGLAHPGGYGFLHAEALLTGVVSGLLALAASFAFERWSRRAR